MVIHKDTAPRRSHRAKLFARGSKGSGGKSRVITRVRKSRGHFRLPGVKRIGKILPPGFKPRPF